MNKIQLMKFDSRTPANDNNGVFDLAGLCAETETSNPEVLAVPFIVSCGVLWGCGQ